MKVFLALFARLIICVWASFSYMFLPSFSLPVCPATNCITDTKYELLSTESTITYTQYARSANRTAYFFTQKDLSTSIFAVPYTYCVQVLMQDNEWYYVRYADDANGYKALYGYCQIKDFDIIEGTPTVTYLQKTITVTYKADDSTINLPVLGQLTVEAVFYGTYYSGATAYSYVLCQGSFGYISGANDNYPLNIEDTTTQTPQDNSDDNTQSSDTSLPNQFITAIILIALVGIVLILLLITARRHTNKIE